MTIITITSVLYVIACSWAIYQSHKNSNELISINNSLQDINQELISESKRIQKNSFEIILKASLLTEDFHTAAWAKYNLENMKKLPKL